MISVVVVNADGSDGIKLPLSKDKPLHFGSDASCEVIVPKKAVAGKKLTLEVGEANSVFLSDLTDAFSAKLNLNDGSDFEVGGKKFRIEMSDKEQKALNGNQLPEKRKPGVSFNTQTIPRFHENGAIEVGTPDQVHKLSKTSLADRYPTPHWTRTVKKIDVNSADSSSEEEDEDEESFEEKQQQYLSYSEKKLEKMKRAMARQERLIEHERSLRTPLNSASLARVKQQVNLESLPSSVRKFLDCRAKKPAAKAVRVAKTAEEQLEMKRAPTPLRLAIREEGLRLEAKRIELLKKIKAFDLDPSFYSLWTIEELSQRVLALEEEASRGGVEAMLVEYGHNPEDFADFTVEEIEDWLEREVYNKKPRKSAVFGLPSFQGKVIEFQSPAPSQQQEAEVENPLLVEEPAKKQVVEVVVKPDEMEVVPAAPVETTVAVPPVEQKGAVPVPPTAFDEQVKKPVVETIDPMKLTCEQIRAELKARGLKTAGLKAVIAERLAQAYAKERDIESMSTDGHEFIGKVVKRTFGSDVVSGKIVAWMPPFGNQMETARFHIVHEDGDDEILDFAETKQAIDGN